MTNGLKWYLSHKGDIVLENGGKNEQTNIMRGLSSFLNIIPFLLSKNFDELIINESETYVLNSF